MSLLSGSSASSECPRSDGFSAMLLMQSPAAMLSPSVSAASLPSASALGRVGSDHTSKVTERLELLNLDFPQLTSSYRSDQIRSICFCLLHLDQLLTASSDCKPQ